MRIAVRNGKDGEWKRIHNGDQQGNGSIKELMHQIPELISVEDLEPGRPSMKVCITNSANGSEDDSGLIGVDDNGRITIIECKVASDPANRREIIGQALEYAATLWEMPYEEFNDMVLASEGASLAEIMSERIPAEKWSEDTFKSAVASSLNQGKFRLMMATQGMTDELKRTIKFLSLRGPFAFETYAVEIQHFSNGETEIAIPRITNLTGAKREAAARETIPVVEAASVSETASPDEDSPPLTEPTFAKAAEPKETPEPPKPADEQSASSERGDKRKEALFFAKCQEIVSQASVEMIRKLYVFSMEVADNIMWWGSGGAGAFNFVLTADQLTVFIVDASGKIMFNFSEWQREPVYKNLLPQFLEKLKDIPILRRQKGDYTKWPDFSVEEFFGNQNDLIRFEHAVKFLKDELAKLAPV